MKEILFKRPVLLMALLAALAGTVQASKEDSTVMTVAGEKVPLSEFLYIAKKNAEVDLNNKQSVKDYVNLFKLFKLKVAQAKAEGIDTTAAFKSELGGYQDQLITGYLSDKGSEDSIIRSVYDRGERAVDLSYILFKLPSRSFASDTAAVYQRAMQVYQRLQQGEDLDVVGSQLMAEDKDQVVYEPVHALRPLQVVKIFEDMAYTLPVGEVSKPFRSVMGYHIMRVVDRPVNEGTVQIGYLFCAFKDTTEQAKTAALTKAQEALDKLKSGSDFSEVVKQYSDDRQSVKNNGVLNPFYRGEVLRPIEEAAFSMKNVGDVSGLIESKYGYHIIKLLARHPRPTFEDSEAALSGKMREGEWGFTLNQAFDDSCKEDYHYVLHADAYRQLLDAAVDSCFPGDAKYDAKVKDYDAVLFEIGGKEFGQRGFTSYLYQFPFSSKTLSVDFMNDIYTLYLHDICVSLEKENMLEKHPDYIHLLHEYSDGILLFDVSNKEVWSKPVDEQKAAEAAWEKRLEAQYPVVINWKLINRIDHIK